MRRPGRIFLLTFLFTVAAAPVAIAQMCKWVDENGTVHYAQTCPDDVPTDEVHMDAAAPSTTPVGGATGPYTGRDPDRDARTLSLQRLGSRPAFTRSRYLVTTSATVSQYESNLGAQFILRLEATDRLMPGALLEARFPDPASPGQATFEQFVYEGLTPMIRLASRPARDFLCWNYHVTVSVFRDASKADLLGTHEQLVQSRFDLSEVRDQDGFHEATSGGGNCPRGRIVRAAPDYSNMTARQLDAECERAREALLKPERESLIRQCKAKEGMEPEWCENYYSDYGAAQRLGPHAMRPPKYSNLPVCVAAREARR